MERIVIGVDPHRLSATIEVVDRHENVLASGRFATDRAGYAAMRGQVAAWPERTWAVQGSNGAGRPLAQHLLADGEHVVDVPAKLCPGRPAEPRGSNQPNLLPRMAVAAAAPPPQPLPAVSPRCR